MVLLIFPHQLFAKHPGLGHDPSRIILLEDSLFFGDPQYPMRPHKQKLWLHRATMKRYEQDLKAAGHTVQYLDYDHENPRLADQLERALQLDIGTETKLCVVEPTDFILEKRLRALSEQRGIDCTFIESPSFLNSDAENQAYRSGKKRWFMADFYKWQRRRLDILMDGDDPQGGQWSFDADNRKRIPKREVSSIPPNWAPERDEIDHEAKVYVEERFGDHPGCLDELFYPSSHRDARRWLEHFFEHRFARFGDFEDAILEGESWLWHSVLTPSLNIGLLTPDEVITGALNYATKSNIAINSLEGFVRQIIGWREFMRATYQDLGVAMRTTNHWQHHQPIHRRFYDGSTGIAPIDDTIRRVLKTGYCHHIERLMVLGGFMFLCEIDPNDIYEWFMEMFVDSYDWVMVPNVYAMSQHADGGSITSKPYFSGSSYIRKMSHYPKEAWCDVWDGLYWRWIWNHKDELRKNPRWAMMCRMAEKMDPIKMNSHLRNAETFLQGIR